MAQLAPLESLSTAKGALAAVQDFGAAGRAGQVYCALAVMLTEAQRAVLGGACADAGLLPGGRVLCEAGPHL